MYKNIIYFNTGGLGDFLMILFFMENVASNIPSSKKNKVKFFIIVQKNGNMLKDLSKRYDYIEVIELNKNNPLIMLGYFFKFFFSTNLAVINPATVQVPWSIKLFSRMITFRQKSSVIGFDDGAEANRFIYSKMITFDFRKLFFENLIELIKEAGFSVKKELPDFQFVKRDDVLEKFELTSGGYIVLHPFAGSFQRNLPQDKFAFLLKEIVEDYNEFQLIVIGNSSEKRKATEILANCGYEKKVLNLCGEVSLPEICNLIELSNLFIGVDTGISHLAALLQKKSLILGNYSNPCWLPSYNKNSVILYDISRCHCAPCDKNKCFDECKTSFLRCLVDISSKRIEENLEKLLS